MLRVRSNTDIKQLIQPQGVQQVGPGVPGGAARFTEFEEDIHFDDNDPDFDHLVPSIPSFIVQVATKMSLASVYPSSEVHSSHSSSMTTLSHSLDDIQIWSSNHHLAATQFQQHQHEPVITIEQLRAQMSSCFTCGVSWAEQQVSLDCAECGGYALQRSCPECEGACGAPEWKRDFTLSHECSKAKWQGICNLNQKSSPLIAQELCSRLEKLSATTQT